MRHNWLNYSYRTNIFWLPSVRNSGCTLFFNLIQKFFIGHLFWTTHLVTIKMQKFICIVSKRRNESIYLIYLWCSNFHKIQNKNMQEKDVQVPLEIYRGSSWIIIYYVVIEIYQCKIEFSYKCCKNFQTKINQIN